MSPITATRPDPNQQFLDQDMNSWERIDPARGPQAAWSNSRGYAIYRSTFTPPRRIQASGGKMVFHAVLGSAEIFLNGEKVGEKTAVETGSIQITVPSSSTAFTVSVLVYVGSSSPGGLTKTVELIPD